MTTVWILLAVAGRRRGRLGRGGHADHRLEYVAKPTVLAALVVAAAAIPADRIDLVDRRWWFVAALVCCLAGDVLLMLPRDLFIPGLAAFLVGHVLFIVGFLQPPTDTAVLVLADRLDRGRGRGGRVEALPGTCCSDRWSRPPAGFIAPVAVYMAAIVPWRCWPSTWRPIAAAGRRALPGVRHPPGPGPVRATIPPGVVAVHVTYHLAQGLLVLSLWH